MIKKSYYVVAIIALLFFASCTQETIYDDGKYSIRLKQMVERYQAAPDLIVKTDSGDFKIDLMAYKRKILVPQWAIRGINMKQVTKDSLVIHFIADTSYKHAKEDWYYLNIPKAIEIGKKYSD